MDKKLWHHLLHRTLDTNKYDYGHVLVIGGSREMVGTPLLTARAALRVGAGLVTIASTADVTQLVDRDIEEIMTVSLPAWSEVDASLATLEAFISDSKVSVLVVGPGLPRAADGVIRTVLSRIKLPTVIDAEAFTALSGHLALLRSAANVNNAIILTPHLGEYSRLTEEDGLHSESSIRTSIKEFVRNYPITLVLKQHKTLVLDSHDKIYEKIPQETPASPQRERVTSLPA